ncbi:hypothetical protein GCM10011518_05020 [Flavobacterium limi]|uniref:Uncharacterized protein n=1 Tax=Flavobacterium limi TaxID=2045105 RepID=A0ABQ1TLQ3_9FLAO|nr:hypothetical protein GCM10011518_05020 [Flavobacterium limi]
MKLYKVFFVFEEYCCGDFSFVEMTEKPIIPHKTKNPIFSERVFYNNLSNDYASNGRIDT